MTRSTKFMQFSKAIEGNRLQDLQDKCQIMASSAKSDFRAQIRPPSGDGALEILLHDAIGDSWAGLDSATLVKEIKANKGKPINLDINSFGGLAFDGIAIYNALAMHDAPVTATISGMAYSAASIIPLAADHIRIAENGDIGIHPAWLLGMGNQYEFADIVEMLQTLDKQLIATYAARTGQPVDQITTWFLGKNHDGTMFNGADAVKHGFADELLPLKTKPVKETAEDSMDSTHARNLKDRLEAFNQKHAAAMRLERIQQMRKQRAT